MTIVSQDLSMKELLEDTDYLLKELTASVALLKNLEKKIRNITEETGDIDELIYLTENDLPLSIQNLEISLKYLNKNIKTLTNLSCNLE